MNKNILKILLFNPAGVYFGKGCQGILKFVRMRNEE